MCTECSLTTWISSFLPTFSMTIWLSVGETTWPNLKAQKKSITAGVTETLGTSNYLTCDTGSVTAIFCEKSESDQFFFCKMSTLLVLCAKWLVCSPFNIFCITFIFPSLPKLCRHASTKMVQIATTCIDCVIHSHTIFSLCVTYQFFSVWCTVPHNVHHANLPSQICIVK